MQALKTAALSGSLPALDKIFQTVKYNETALVQFFPILSQLLQSTNIPHETSPDREKHRFLIVTKYVFRSICSGMSDSPASNPALVAHLSSYIPHLCKFAIAFFQLFVLDHAALSPSHIALTEEMMEMVLPLSLDRMFGVAPVFKVVSNYSGLFDSLTRVWVLVTTDKQPGPVADRYLTLMVGVVMQSERESPAMSEFHHVLEQSSSPIINCLVQRVINDLRLTPIDVLSVRHNSFMLLQSSMGSFKIYKECVESHTAKWCCVIMQHLLSRKYVLPINSERIVVDTVADVLGLLRFAFQEGSLMIVEAMDHGLIDCVFRFQPLLDWCRHNHTGSSLVRMLAGLIDLLNAWTMYRPVLRASRKAIKMVLHKNLDRNLKKEGLIWAAWVRFGVVVDQRCAAKANMIEIKHQDWCDNVLCKVFARADLRLNQCVACKESYYCSYACQRAAWKNGHREDCQARQKAMKDGSQIFLTQREVRFLFAMVEADFEFHSDELHKLVDDFLKAHRVTTALADSIVFQCDYVSVPREVTITTADKITRYSDWLGIVKRSRTSGGRLVDLTVQDKGEPVHVCGSIEAG